MLALAFALTIVGAAAAVVAVRVFRLARRAAAGLAFSLARSAKQDLLREPRRRTCAKLDESTGRRAPWPQS